jgi:general secretion pathway protein I
MQSRKPAGFTLIEVVAALAIISIALLALLRLHLLSIRAADKAQVLSQAVFLAQEKIAETLSGGYPPVGTQSGIVETDGPQLTWRTEVTDARPASSHASDLKLNRLRRLSVDVAWPEGAGQDHIQMTTYVADRTIHE